MIKPYRFTPNAQDTTANRIAALEAAVAMLTAGFHVATPNNAVEVVNARDGTPSNPNTVVKFN